jgi:hypothetical protein
VLPQEKGPGIRNPHGRSLLNYLWPQVRAQYEEAWAARQQAPPPQMMFLFQDSKLPQTIQRLAALPQAEKTMAAAATAGGALKEFAADSRERVVGVIIHGFLERMARTGELAWDAAAVKAAAEFHGVEPEQVGLAVARALERTVADPRAQWILRRREAAQVEWAISDAGERRVIDRTFIEDGVRWVVDYKTGAGTGYREQLERYGRLVQSMEGLPVRLGVYFPLTGEWEDWAL